MDSETLLPLLLLPLLEELLPEAAVAAGCVAFGVAAWVGVGVGSSTKVGVGAKVGVCVVVGVGDTRDAGAVCCVGVPQPVRRTASSKSMMLHFFIFGSSFPFLLSQGIVP